MRFVWDEVKRQANFRKHGLDFAEAAGMFDGPMLVQLDTRKAYGEDRWIGIGAANNRILVVVYVEDDDTDTVRIISLRKALSHERKGFQEYLTHGLGMG